MRSSKVVRSNKIIGAEESRRKLAVADGGVWVFWEDAVRKWRIWRKPKLGEQDQQTDRKSIFQSKTTNSTFMIGGSVQRAVVFLTSR